MQNKTSHTRRLEMNFSWAVQMGLLTLSVVGSSTNGDKVETCELETLQLRCLHDTVISIGNALYGRIQDSRCLTGQFAKEVRCSVNVTSYLERQCTGRRSCNISIPNQDLMNLSAECAEGLTKYLDVTHFCQNVYNPPDDCADKPLRIPTRTSTSGYLANVITEETNKGSSRCPWYFDLDSNQTVNLKLLDFGVWQSSPNDNPKDSSVTIYAKINDVQTGNMHSVVSGQEFVYKKSGGNLNVTIFKSKKNENSKYFLIHYEVFGVPEISPPPGSVEVTSTIPAAQKTGVIFDQVTLMIIIIAVSIIMSFIIVACGIFCLHKCPFQNKISSPAVDNYSMQTPTFSNYCGNMSHSRSVEDFYLENPEQGQTGNQRANYSSTLPIRRMMPPSGHPQMFLAQDPHAQGRMQDLYLENPENCQNTGFQRANYASTTLPIRHMMQPSVHPDMFRAQNPHGLGCPVHGARTAGVPAAFGTYGPRLVNNTHLRMGPNYNMPAFGSFPLLDNDRSFDGMRFAPTSPIYNELDQEVLAYSNAQPDLIVPMSSAEESGSKQYNK